MSNESMVNNSTTGTVQITKNLNGSMKGEIRITTQGQGSNNLGGGSVEIERNSNALRGVVDVFEKGNENFGEDVGKSGKEESKKKGDDFLNGSIALTGGFDKKSHGGFKVERPVNKSVLFGINKKLEFLLKFIAALAVILGVYGFEYQKGMVEAIGLENIGANYEIKEIYHFAFIGFIGIINRVLSIDSVPNIYHFIFITSLFVGLGFLLYIMGRFFKSKESNDNEDIKKWSFNDDFLKVMSSFKLSIIVWSIIGLVMSFVQQSFFKIIVILFFCIFAAPSYIGYLNGWNDISELKSKPLCKEPILNEVYDSSVKTCPILTLKGHEIWGEIVLLTNDAYFIRKGNYFAYITKNGDNCAFSHYSKKDEKSTFTLDPDIQSLCFKKPDVAKAKNS